jgi:serine/threonine protein phosphatase PrpC
MLAHFYHDSLLGDGSGLYAVLDGHGGIEVVEYVTKVLPEVFLKEIALWNPSQPLAYFEHVFKKVDDQLRLVGASEIGSTCCLTLIKKEGCKPLMLIGLEKRMMYIANLGDTRAVLNASDKALRLTVDHKSTNEDEQMRVKQQGGSILRNRVMG